MKYLLITLLLFGCSNRNQLTTQLLNEKKAIVDSINLANNYESFYRQKAKETMRDTNDSLKWEPLIDSSVFFYMKAGSLDKKLKAIDFSLDSLSRMK